MIEHFGGIVVSGDTVIGDDVTLRHGVTLGLRRTSEPGAPVIGDGVVIGANAVVLCDVPPGALAVGIPARIKSRSRAAQPLPPRLPSAERPGATARPAS